MRITNFRLTLATVGVAVMAATGLAVGLAGPASAASDSMVYVVHGIPGQPVDVYVNGKKTLDTFAPATVAGPLTLPAGTYDVALPTGSPGLVSATS